MNSRLVCQDESENAPRETAARLRVLAFPARAAIFLIEIYQRYISPYTPPTCRFYPTCSCYAREAIARFGFWRGLTLGAWRILRCNPMNVGGDDPVPAAKVPEKADAEAPPRAPR